METPKNQVPEATSTNSQQPKSLKERMEIAWTKEAVKDLGESQAERQAKWVTKDIQDHGIDSCLGPGLQLLEDGRLGRARRMLG